MGLKRSGQKGLAAVESIIVLAALVGTVAMITVIAMPGGLYTLISKNQAVSAAGMTFTHMNAPVAFLTNAGNVRSVPADLATNRLGRVAHAMDVSASGFENFCVGLVDVKADLNSAEILDPGFVMREPASGAIVSCSRAHPKIEQAALAAIGNSLQRRDVVIAAYSVGTANGASDFWVKRASVQVGNFEAAPAIPVIAPIVPSPVTPPPQAVVPPINPPIINIIPEEQEQVLAQPAPQVFAPNPQPQVVIGPDGMVQSFDGGMDLVVPRRELTPSQQSRRLIEEPGLGSLDLSIAPMNPARRAQDLP